LSLALNTEQWLAVADGIRQGRCNIKNLYLDKLESSSSEDTEAIKALASAIRLDQNLEHLSLEMENDFTDEAGMALAEALTVNESLCRISLSVGAGKGKAKLGAPTYDAFSAMMRVNTSLVLDLPPSNGSGDQKLADSRNRMRIEELLNAVGRGRLLLSRQTPRKEWVVALDELNCCNSVGESPEFNVSCLYSLLRLNPATCM
jgi:hypothetical protein